MANDWFSKAGSYISDIQNNTWTPVDFSDIKFDVPQFNPADLYSSLDTIKNMTFDFKYDPVKIDTTQLISQLNAMLNSISKNTIKSYEDMKTSIGTPLLKTTQLFAENITEKIREIEKSMKTIKTDADIKENVALLTRAQTDLDKLLAASTGTEIEKNIQAIADTGRNTIYDIANDMNKIISQLDQASKTIKTTKISTDDQRKMINSMLEQIENNREILINSGTSVMEKIAELTKTDISKIQTISTAMKDATDQVKATIVNNITKESRMAYDLNEIKKDPILETYLKSKGFISKTEEKNEIIASEKVVDGKTLFQTMIEYYKGKPSAKMLMPKLLEVEIGEVERVVEKTTDKKVYPTMEITEGVKIDLKPIGFLKVPEKVPALYSLSQYIKDHPTDDPEEIAKMFYPNETGLESKIQTIKSAQNDLKRTEEDRKEGRGLSYSTWEILDRTVLVTDPELQKKYGTTYIFQRNLDKDEEERLANERMQKQLLEQASTMSQYYIPGMESSTLKPIESLSQKPNETVLDWMTRISKSYGQTTIDTGKLNIVKVEGKQDIATEDKNILDLAGNWLNNYYYRGKDNDEVLIQNGYGSKAYVKVGERTYNEDMGYIELMLNGIGELMNKQKGIDTKAVVVDKYIPDPEATKIVKDAVMNGKTAPGLTEYYTKYAFYQGATTTDMMDYANTERGAMEIAVDLTNPDTKDIIMGKLAPTTLQKINEQYQNPEVARRVTYLPGYTMSAAVETVVNPYMTGDPITDVGFMILTGGVWNETDALVKGSMGVLGKALGATTDIGKGIASSAGIMSTLMVPGIVDTSKIADVVKADKSIWEVTSKGDITTWTETPNMAKLENTLFSAATNKNEAPELLKSIIQEHTYDPDGTIAKLTAMKLSDPISFREVTNITPGKTISDVEISVAKEIFEEATNKTDTLTREFAENIKTAYETGESPLANVLNVRQVTGEIPIENLLNNAFTIDHGKYMEPIFKLMDEMKTTSMEVFNPVLEKMDLPTYTPGWKVDDAMKMIDNMKNVSDDMKHATQLLIDNLGLQDNTIDNVVRLIDAIDKTKLDEITYLVKVVPDDVMEIRNLLYELSTSKGKLMADTRPIPKSADIIHLDKVFPQMKTGEIVDALTKNKVQSMADFASLRPSEIADIAKNSDISETKLLNTQRGLKSKINWDADTTEEAALRSKLTGKKTVDEGGQVIMETGDEYDATEITWKDWRLSGEKEVGIWKNDATGKWEMRNVTLMKESTFDNFVDGIPLSTLREMNIDDIGKLSSDAEEDMLRREMLHLAQNQAKEDIAIAKQVAPEMSITGKSMGLEEEGTIYITQTTQGITKASELRDAAKQRIRIGEATEITLEGETGLDKQIRERVTELNAQRRSAGYKELTEDETMLVREKLIADREDIIEDIRTSGDFGAPETQIPEMTITGRDTKFTTDATQTRLKESYWDAPEKIPDDIDEATSLATRTKSEIINRATNVNVDDTLRAMDGDIDALNRVYTSDIRLGEMIDTHIATNAKISGQITTNSVKHAMNALSNGRDTSALQVLKQMGDKSSLKGYVDNGLFNDITMKDITRIQDELSDSMTKNMMNAKYDAAMNMITKTDPKIGYKLQENIELTLDELRALTKEDTILKSTLDATYNPLGHERNILKDYAEALGKEGDNVKKAWVDGKLTKEDAINKLAELENEKNIMLTKNDIARELVC